MSRLCEFPSRTTSYSAFWSSSGSQHLVRLWPPPRPRIRIGQLSSLLTPVRDSDISSRAICVRRLSAVSSSRGSYSAAAQRAELRSARRASVRPTRHHAVTESIARLLTHLDAADPGGVIGLYLHGSGVDVLHRDSDIDLLLVTRRSLAQAEREQLVAVLMDLSGWHGHVERFPDVALRRPVELTSVVLGRVSTEPALAHRDFQFGEWLRADIVDGKSLQPTDDPDVVLLIASAISRHVVLRGPEMTSVLPAVPCTHAREAALRVMPSVIQNAAGDERNALLTVARILVTAHTGTIVSKDAAAARIIA